MAVTLTVWGTRWVVENDRLRLEMPGSVPLTAGSVLELRGVAGDAARDVDAARRANDGRVAGYRTGARTLRTQQQEPSPIRTEIQDARKRFQGQAASAADGFDSKAQIVETPDGTLKSKKSLFATAGKQVVGDADVSLDAAKDAVKSVLKRDK
mgnify:CR=1 FL=1